MPGAARPVGSGESRMFGMFSVGVLHGVAFLSVW